ncbi:unnamed protein product [Discosporangium mesarthrocarpum]
MYVMDLIITAYLLFDSQARGFISRCELERKLREAERERKGGGGALLDPTKWGELAWDDGGRLSFQEFVYGFSDWVELGEEDGGDEEDEREARPVIRKPLMGGVAEVGVDDGEVTPQESMSSQNGEKQGIQGVCKRPVVDGVGSELPDMQEGLGAAPGMEECNGRRQGGVDENDDWRTSTAAESDGLCF